MLNVSTSFFTTNAYHVREEILQFLGAVSGALELPGVGWLRAGLRKLEMREAAYTFPGCELVRAIISGRSHGDDPPATVLAGQCISDSRYSGGAVKLTPRSRPQRPP